MGLFDSMFGGGTGLEITLDGDTVSGGEALTGTITVRGGKKAATITSLKVQVLGSRVGGAGDFEHRLLFDGAIAQDVALPASESIELPLSLDIPEDADPSHDYQLTATADIPGVADPSAKVSFTVLGPDDGDDSASVYTVDEVLGQWPALTGHDAEAFRDAAVELDELKENFNVSAGAEVLRRRFHDEDAELRDTAIWWYARLLGPTANAAAAAPLLALIQEHADDTLFLDGLADAAGKLGPAGEEILAVLARSRHPSVRRTVGFALPSAGGPRQRELAEALARDAEPQVASAGLKALGGKLLLEPGIVARLVSEATHSDKDELRVHALYALSDAPEYGVRDAALPAFAVNVRHGSDQVRSTIAEALPKWPQSPELMRLIEQLASDSDPHVRGKLMNAHDRDCPAHLRPLWERVADQDPDENVRMFARQALEG
ncbi:sporulation protein [Corallococcus terminator]